MSMAHRETEPLTTPAGGRAVDGASVGTLAARPDGPPATAGGRRRQRDRRPLLLLIAAAILVMVMVAGVSLGSVRVSLADIWPALLGDHTGSGRFIVWNLRLPRVLLAVLVGMNLAVAGAILQSVTRNPLADPHLLGLSAGGALAAVLALHLAPAMAVGNLPPLAFGGSLLGAAIVYTLAWRGGVSPTRLILAGVAIGALFTAFTTGLLLSSSLTIQAIMSWLAGGLYARSWQYVRILAPYWAGGMVAAMLLARQLDVLALGDEPASVLGLRVQRLRALLTGLAALLTGSAVAVAGLIGFVGLVVPLVARMLVGSGNRYVLPMSALLGGSLLVASDLIARTVASPRELPVGIVTAAIGAPFFIYLLRSRV